MAVPDFANPFSFRNHSRTGVLLLHGFTGMPGTVRPLGECLSSAGFDVEGPLLSGHGTHWRDMNRCTGDDWLADGEKALALLKQRCPVVFLAGLSMGGAVALNLAADHPEIKGIVLINHALFLNRAPGIMLLPLARFFMQSLPTDASDIKNPDAVRMAYDRIPVPALYQMTRLMRRVRSRLGAVRQPVLIFKSRQDHVIPVRSATYTYDHIGSGRKQVVWLENSYHVATQDFDCTIICDKSLEFINNRLGEDG